MHGHGRHEPTPGVVAGMDMDTDMDMDMDMIDQEGHEAQDVIALEATPRIAALTLSSPQKYK